MNCSFEKGRLCDMTKEKKNVLKSSSISNKTSKEEMMMEEQAQKTHHVLVIFCVILIIAGIVIGCMFSPAFDLEDIIVSDGKNVTKEEILNSFHVEKGSNVFKVNYKEITSKVQELPYIQTASVKLKFPNCIEIDYVEREPVAFIKYLESYLVMDKYGYFLELAREKKFEDLPIIYNIQFEFFEIGKQLTGTAKTKYDNVVYLLETAKQRNFGFHISEVNYESIGNVKMWVSEEDIEIVYGEINRNMIEEKLDCISKVLASIRGKKGKIDVSSENYLERTLFTERY